MVGNPDDLQRVITNLLENALRHTPPNTRVTASTRPLPDGSAELVVADDGPGIPPELRPELFARFVRGTGDRGGSFGLGLAIVAAVAQAHGGTVEADDSPHGGARFTVRLPPAVAEQPHRRSRNRRSRPDRTAQLNAHRVEQRSPQARKAGRGLQPRRQAKPAEDCSPTGRRSRPRTGARSGTRRRHGQGRLENLRIVVEVVRLRQQPEGPWDGASAARTRVRQGGRGGSAAGARCRARPRRRRGRVSPRRCP